MRPILFYVKGLTIYSYGTMLALAFLVGILMTCQEGKEHGIPTDDILDISIVIIFTALIGSRMGYILLEPGISIRDFFNVRQGGLSFHGGFLAAFLSGLIFCKIRGYSLPKLADIITPALPLGYSIARIGCLLNGCCFGYPSNVPWAFASSALDDLPRHPTQLYSFASSLIIFFILWRTRKKIPFPGYLFLLYIGLYSVTRFLIEFFRESQYIFGWLKVAQLVSIISAILSFGIIKIKLQGVKGGDLAS